MLKFLYILTILCWGSILYCQNENYERQFTLISKIIENPTSGSFKKAVLLTEEVFNKEVKEDFENKIKHLKSLSLLVSGIQKNLNYPQKDSLNIRKLTALYSLFTDTISLSFNGNIIKHFPFSYDFDDAFGKKNWESMFVTNLLATQKGNCHSLPFLYKILADEIGAECHLALAPNHIYIKSKSEKVGWYNTELTSGTFPIDAWIMASGYIPLEAIQSGIYMRALSDKEAIAMCVVDLAMGYDRKYPDNDGTFIFKCCDLALKHFSNYITAILLKAETNQRLIRSMMKQHNLKDHKALFAKEKSAKSIWEEMGKNYFLAHQLGYRQMPKKMYLDWLASLEKEKNKYANRKVPAFKN